VLAAGLLAAALVLGVFGTSVGLVRAQARAARSRFQRQQAEMTVSLCRTCSAVSSLGPALGRDTAILRELMDEAATKIEAGTLRQQPGG